ncbi:MAG TPA: glycosyltransferase family 2 protein [Pyrinomonadaceae bacterium]|nr:glycosyltransferase family 2 protein [Pyrinomonadaceae bacterium]
MKPRNLQQQVKVALVIPVYNRRETTLRALRSLTRINKDGLEVKIFVVDDGSTDGTGDAIRAQYPEVVLLNGGGTLHYAGGTSLGMQKALEWEPEYICTMNDDSVFHPDFLQRLVAAASKFQKSVIGALLLLWSEPHKVFQVNQRWNTLQGGWVIPKDLTAFNIPKSTFEVECIVGNTVLFPADGIRKLGLMDAEKFPFGWGDAQYTMRFRKNGYRLFVEPKALVWCEPNTDPPSLHTLSSRRVLEILLFDERHPLNLRRQFVARVESAPSIIKALLAYLAYLVRFTAHAVKMMRKRINMNSLSQKS